MADSKCFTKIILIINHSTWVSIAAYSFFKKKTKQTKRIFRVQYSICTEDKNIIALAQTHIANI